ncbi:MAG: hypothetical protein Q7U66_12130 [Methylobacter sp.]|nr:hypothetical protein [Methylobacter sp.]
MRRVFVITVLIISRMTYQDSLKPKNHEFVQERCFDVAKVRKKEQLHRTEAIRRLKNKLSSRIVSNPLSSLYTQNLCQSWLAGNIEQRLAVFLD